MFNGSPNSSDLRNYFCQKLKESKASQIQESVPAKTVQKSFSIPEQQIIEKPRQEVSEAIKKQVKSIPIRKDIIKALMHR